MLVRGLSHPDYASAAVFNPLDLQADVPIYAWDENAEVRAQALAAYADRPVYFVNGPSISQGGFEVIAGPLPAAALLSGEVVAP